MRKKMGDVVVVRSDSASNSKGAKVAPARRFFGVRILLQEG